MKKMLTLALHPITRVYEVPVQKRRKAKPSHQVVRAMPADPMPAFPCPDDLRARFVRFRPYYSYSVYAEHTPAAFTGMTWWRDTGEWVGIYIVKWWRRGETKVFTDKFIFALRGRSFFEVRQFPTAGTTRTLC